MIFNNINAHERGRTAFSKGKFRQPMNDKQFVALIADEVAVSNDVPRTVKAYYITQWKGGWDEARDEAAAKAAPVKKKAKKKATKKKAKKK